MPKLTEATLKKRRINKYKEAFSHLDNNTMMIVEKTIECIVDLEFRIDKLQKELDTIGFVEEYQNGNNQFGTKESTISKAYSNVLKNYNSLIRTLLSYSFINQSSTVNNEKQAKNYNKAVIDVNNQLKKVI